MKKIVVDVETFYSKEYSLRKMTFIEYILDPRFECIGWAVKEDGGESVWMDPDEFRAYLASLPPKVMMISHNANFDMSVLAWHFNYVPHLMVDTLGMARAWYGHKVRSLALANLARFLRLGEKGTTVHKVEGMSLAAIKASGFYDEYAEYSKGDADLCWGVFTTIMGEGFPLSEIPIMDSVTRCAVVPRFELDANLLAEHLQEVRAGKEHLLARIGATTRDDLMSNDRFAAALERLGVDPPRKISLTTGKETWAFAKTDREFMDLEEHENPEVQALVSARLGVKSTIEETRTERFLSIANLTWRGKRRALMPMPLRYSGAHTHRLSGDAGLNVQNLGRGSKLRYSLRAPKGCAVVAVDASQIEARVAGWFCGAGDLVGAFANKEDVYSSFAGKVFGYPVNKKEHPVERFIGKTCLAGDTLVLADSGWLPITYINTSHLLWDGMEWVTHDGLLYQGTKEVLTHKGLSATSDHEILTERGWLEWSEVRRSPSLFRSALASANSKLLGGPAIPQQVNRRGGNRLASALAVGWGRFCGTTSRTVARPDVSGAPGSRSAGSPTSKLVSATSKRALPVYDIANAGPRRRFTVWTEDGPIVVHNCILGLQYGLGWSKFQKTTAMQSKAQVGQEVILDDLEAARVVQTYRSTYHQIPATWSVLNNMLPQMTRDVYRELGPVTFLRRQIRLPSGLFLNYHELQNVEGGWQFTYGGIPKRIYGGAMLENITQALARIIVMDAAARIRRETGRTFALQVHDELVYVVREQEADDLCKYVIEQMSRPPAWGFDIPLAAEGDVGDSYGAVK